MKIVACKEARGDLPTNLKRYASSPFYIVSCDLRIYQRHSVQSYTVADNIGQPTRRLITEPKTSWSFQRSEFSGICWLNRLQEPELLQFLSFCVCWWWSNLKYMITLWQIFGIIVQALIRQVLMILWKKVKCEVWW